jgi:cytochrome b pre-mRNA-processing protein 3
MTNVIKETMPILQRLHQFLSGPADDPVVAQLYSTCVTQARLPIFYDKGGVPDTIDGRFDMILLHVYLLMRRLKTEDKLKQQLFDLMFADMDHNLREMGVGDMSIGKKIKPMIGAFYGRAQAYEAALPGNDGTLAITLQRNLYGTKTVEAGVIQHMAQYVRQTVAALDSQLMPDIASGRVVFPTPAF